MVAPEYHRAYRRGIVLGLSLAELFILLVFLLLLALLGYALSRDDHAARQAQAIAEQQKQLAEQQEQLDALAPIVDADPNALRQRIVQLAREKSDAEKRAEEAERDAESAEVARQAAEQKYQQLKQAKKDSEVLGQFSPCWYVVVQEQSGEREKAVFTFDVRMRNETVLVQKHYRPPPPGAHTPAVEYDRAALGRELRYAEFMRKFEPLKIAGREKRVRDRECYFHVQVWDTTTDKTAYKSAFNDYVREVFVPTSVRRDPWPH